MENGWMQRVKETSSIIHDDIVSMDILLDGEPISHVGIREREIVIYGCRTKIGSIGGVATKPEYRNQGLATRLMENSMRRIDEDGGDVMFVSGGRGLYRRLGCVDAGEAREFVIKRTESDNLKEQHIQLLPYRDEDIVKLVAAYQKEPVRFHRPLENFKFNLQRHPVPLWITPDVLIIPRSGEFWGYMAVQESKKKEGRQPGHGYISEYAGDRRAVVSAIPKLFQMYDFDDLSVWAPRHDTELIHILSDKGFKSKKRSIHGHTFKIINFPRLMKRFCSYIEERVGMETANLLEFTQEEDRFGIKLGDEEFSTDGRSLALIVFGSYDGREQKLMPLRKAEGGRRKAEVPDTREIAEVLDVLFPLPFIWPGLDSF